MVHAYFKFLLSLIHVQLPLCPSKSLRALMELQEKVSASLVEYLKLKISTPLSPISGIRTAMMVKYKLEPTLKFSHSLQFDCLMLLIILVQSPLLRAISQVALMQWHLEVSEFKVDCLFFSIIIIIAN